LRYDAGQTTDTATETEGSHWKCANLIFYDTESQNVHSAQKKSSVKDHKKPWQL